MFNRKTDPRIDLVIKETNQVVTNLNNANLCLKAELDQLRATMLYTQNQVQANLDLFKAANVRMQLVQIAMDRLTRLEGTKGFDAKRIIDLAHSLTHFVCEGTSPDPASQPQPDLKIVPLR